MKKYNGKVAQEIIEKNLQEHIEKCHKNFIDCENKKVAFSQLDTDSQKYVKEIKKLYDSVINGNLHYNTIDNKTKNPEVDIFTKAVYRDAKHKVENKVSRAILRRELVTTNKQINHLATTTNGFNPYNKNMVVNDNFARSSVNKVINDKFCALVDLNDLNVDLLSIHGLSSLNTFKKLIIKNYESSDDKKQNSVIFNNALKDSTDQFISYINSGLINPNDVYHLTTSISADKAKTLLANISDDIKLKCINECPYVVNIENPINTYSYIKNNEDTLAQEENLESMDKAKSHLYYDGIYGNPLRVVNGEFVTQDGRRYEGDVYELSPDGDDFDYIETIDSKNYDELDNIRQNQNTGYNDGM